MTLKQLKCSPRDLRSVFNSSIFFRKLFETCRVDFLFENVLQVIVEHCVGKQFEAQELNDPNATFKSYIRKNDQQLKEAIINCRLANTCWNAAVKKCFESPVLTGITPLIVNPMKRTTVIRPLPGNELKFSYQSSPQNIRLFFENFKNSLKNPFLGRHVRFDVYVGNDDYSKVYINNVGEIMKTFGKHIWYLTLVFWVAPGNVAYIVKAYLKLAEWLNLTPCVIVLCVQLNSYEARKIIQRFIVENPLPTLKHLKLLETHELTGPILEELISVNDQVDFMRINSNQLLDRPISSFLPKLNGIGLRYTGIQHINHLDYVGLNCELEMLHIHEEYDRFNVNLSFHLMSEYWSHSLTDVTLDLTYPKDNAKMVADSRLWQLNLPQLERLSLRIYGIYFMDFMLPLQKLKCLEVMMVSDDYVENYDAFKENVMSQQIIEFWGFETRLNKSNVWKKLNSLDKIQLIFGGHFGQPVTCHEYKKVLYH